MPGTYAPASCAGIDEAVRRKEICELKDAGNSAVQQRLTEVLGIAPDKMCASADNALRGTVSATPPAVEAEPAEKPVEE